MVGPINVFGEVFGGLLSVASGQGSVDKIVSDTAKVAARTADGAAKTAEDAEAEIRTLRTAIERLILVNRALWEFIAASQGLTDEQLMNKIKEIDLRDGTLDGKIGKPVRKCASCGKVLPAGREKCIYCGAKNEGADAFDTIDTETPSLRKQRLV
jgi:hypothetical protein